MGFDYIVRWVIINPCYPLKAKTEATTAHPGKDLFLTPGSVMNLNLSIHSLEHLKKRIWPQKNCPTLFSLYGSIYGQSVTLQGGWHRGKRNHLARSLLRRVLPPNPCWWLPKEWSYLKMIRPMWAILFFPGPRRKFVHTCQCSLPLQYLTDMTSFL